MSYRFPRLMGFAGALALAGLAACSDNVTQPKADNAALTSTDSAASNSLLSDFFGMFTTTVTVTIDSSSIAVGHAAHAVAVVKTGGKVVSNAAVSWSSSDASKATVSSNGVISGVAAGTPSITASYSGKAGKASISVVATSTAPTTGTAAAIQVSLASPSILVGATTQATYTILDAVGKLLSGLTVSWTSSNTAVATVSSSGVVKGIAPGTAAVYASTLTGVHSYTPVTVTAAVTAPTQPTTDPVQPTQPSGTGNLAAADFENGSYGSLMAETPGHLSIISDPTSSGHGKIMQVAFACGGTAPACIQPGTTRADLNQFASWNPTSGLSLGSTFYFKSQVYFPANTPHFNDGTLRKLIYFRTSSSQQFDYVVNMFGTDVGLEMTGTSQPDQRTGGIYTMPLGQWVTLEVSITTNSKPGVKDGSTTIWINGNQVLQKTGIAFVGSSESSSTRWSWMAIGHQREGVDGDSTPISEVRYWDNVAFGTSRIK